MVGAVLILIAAVCGFTLGVYFTVLAWFAVEPRRRRRAALRVRAEVLAPQVTAVVTSTRRPPALPR
jgi:hypothetical protein